jgi:hypothetical protein
MCGVQLNAFCFQGISEKFIDAKAIFLLESPFANMKKKALERHKKFSV